MPLVVRGGRIRGCALIVSVVGTGVIAASLSERAGDVVQHHLLDFHKAQRVK